MPFFERICAAACCVLALECSRKGGEVSPRSRGVAPHETSTKPEQCEQLDERRLSDRAEPASGLTPRRLTDGRLAIGLVVDGQPCVVTVNGDGSIGVDKAKVPGVAGKALRVTPTWEAGVPTALVDAQTPDGGAICLGERLASCRSFEAPSGQTWVVGSKRVGDRLTLVAKRPGLPGEHEIFRSPAGGPDAFSDLESEFLGDNGFAVSARLGDRVVLGRLGSDLSVTEAREYGPGFMGSPQLLGAGSGAMLLATREALGHPHLAWAQFQDAKGHLPEYFDGSDHGLEVRRARRATAGSRTFLLFWDAAEHLALTAVDAYFRQIGATRLVSKASAKVADAVLVGLDDGRLVVVYLAESGPGYDLFAQTLRCP